MFSSLMFIFDILFEELRPLLTQLCIRCVSLLIRVIYNSVSACLGLSNAQWCFQRSIDSRSVHTCSYATRHSYKLGIELRLMRKTHILTLFVGTIDLTTECLKININP